MKAIHLIKYGDSDKAFEVRDIPIPKPQKGQILIKVETFGLNFADVVARRGLYPDAPKNPAVLGYDVAGTVQELGGGVTNVEIGDRVTALTRFGGYAEYALTMAEGVAKLPDNVSHSIAPALATQSCTAYYSAVHCVNLIPGDKVLIQAAAGGVGINLVQIAKHHGCQIYGTASSSKIDYLKELGVDYPIDYRNVDFSEYIKSLEGNHKLDYVFDSIGGQAFKKGFKLLGQGGTMVNFGAASQIGGTKLKALAAAAGFGLFSPVQLLLSSKSMIAVNMLRIADFKPHLFQRIFEGVMDYVDKGVIKPALSKEFNASEIAEAHAFLESRKSIGKIVLNW